MIPFYFKIEIFGILNSFMLVIFLNKSMSKIHKIDVYRAHGSQILFEYEVPKCVYLSKAKNNYTYIHISCKSTKIITDCVSRILMDLKNTNITHYSIILSLPKKKISYLYTDI